MQQYAVIFVIPAITCLFAWLLMSFDFHTNRTLRNRDLAQRVNALLPQTQCGKCSYAGCQPYAEAIAGGKTDINHCPPGGDETIRNIAILLGRNKINLDSEHEQQLHQNVALIDEQVCIGCVKCINACPVDAIIGAAKQMHTVISKACTGCELCISPCPVDCISMVPVNVEIKKWVWTKPQPGFEVNI